MKKAATEGILHVEFFCQLCYNMYDDDFGEYCLNEGITSRLFTV